MLDIIKTLFISFLMVIITILGDYLIKNASQYPGYSGWKLILTGAFLYAISSLGWFWVYRTTKFFTVGAIHSFGIMIITVVISIMIFKEKINLWEMIGLVLGAISLFILIKNGSAA